jgi:hypothetical protein
MPRIGHGIKLESACASTSSDSQGSRHGKQSETAAFATDGFRPSSLGKTVHSLRRTFCGDCQPERLGIDGLAGHLVCWHAAHFVYLDDGRVHMNRDWKWRPLVRALGILILVLVFWALDQRIARLFPDGTPWRYVLGAMVWVIGLGAVLGYFSQFSQKGDET